MKLLMLLACFLIAAPLTAETKILAFSGSTREDSFNKKLLKQVAEIAKAQGATVTIIDLKDFPMPFYDADVEQKQGMPLQAKRLRDLMIGSHAVIIASPEYNGSVSSVLKNALDWVSRSPDGGPSRDAFKGKRFGLMSASPGKSGGSRGLVHLRDIISDVGGEVVSMQVSIPNAHQAFNSRGQLDDPMLVKSLQNEVMQLMQP